MPKNFHKILVLISLMVVWFNGLISPVHASTDPLSATASATATVPSTTPLTSDTTAPSSPVLVRPFDGTITSDNKPEFVWTRSEDPDSNTVLYTLYLNGVATYLGISNLGNSAGNGYTAQIDGDEIKLNPTVALPDGLYSWYVTASDLSGNTSHSQTWHFTIDTVAPPVTIIDIENYHNPLISEGANFDIDGPKDIYFTIHSDPYVTILVTISQSGSIIHTLQSLTNPSGFTYPYGHLVPGVYQVIVKGSDPAGNSTTLPGFTLTIHQAQFSLTIPPIPGLTPGSTVTTPYTPISVPSFPATISKITTRPYLTYLMVLLLAILLLILLILLNKRKYNLLILNDKGQPLKNTKVYHSIPTESTSRTPIFMTKREPLSYDLVSSDQGRLYIPHLTRYSTLTIQSDSATYVLSLSVKRSLYTLILG